MLNFVNLPYWFQGSYFDNPKLSGIRQWFDGDDVKFADSSVKFPVMEINGGLIKFADGKWLIDNGQIW